MASNSGEPTAAYEGTLFVQIVLQRRVLSSFSDMIRMGKPASGADAEASSDAGSDVDVGLVTDAIGSVMVFTI